MKTFFKKIGFSFGADNSDIKPHRIRISENNHLTKKLENKVFVYNSPDLTNCSFYVITIPLKDEDLFQVRRYIWNESKYDLYFLKENNENKNNLSTALYYAKTKPQDEQSKIASFKGNDEDNRELEKIKKWKFDSGAFWLEYTNFLTKIKERKTRVDKELIEQLKQLKNKLHKELPNEKEIVQALIDRTLFIKFLEDNHIINSDFYNFYFSKCFSENDIDFGYKKLLSKHDKKNINKLFDEINGLFGGILFKTPDIKEKYLTNEVLNLIYETIKHHDWNTGQISLFDFRFDVIPTEFISHIYEVFLENKQLRNGIYYTPFKLVDLIIDETITKAGTVLDPACGSGMFLVLAYRKILEKKPSNSNDIAKQIEHKNKLLSDYIFGIEKEYTAWRLTVFSLYLEVLKGIPPAKLKEFINQKLKHKTNKKIFRYDFSKNIIHHNALETKKESKPHKNKTFDYIIGNPPFLEIKSASEEISFINEYSLSVNDRVLKASEVIGYNQISQAFMLKIKEWSNFKTKFGFVLNSSNFYNDKSRKFQDFFFRYYRIERFYELSRVKEILFEKAKENVIVTIFNNKPIENNNVNYFPVEMGIFSKPFDLLIIQEDKKIKIPQKDILNNNVLLRDYLIGNEYDLKLLNKLTGFNKFIDYFSKDKRYTSLRGLTRISNKELKVYLDNTEKPLDKLTTKEWKKKHEDFAVKNYLSKARTIYYNTPYIYQPDNKIKPFCILNVDGYMNIRDINKQNFQRIRTPFIYDGNKIIFNKFGKNIEAAFVNYNLFFSNLLYVIKLKNENLYPLFTAILNSNLINYYLLLKFRMRVDGNFSNLDTTAIKNIPIPQKMDSDLVTKISRISKQLTNGKLRYEGETKEKLNTLIFDLYNLSFLERQRIKDFFATKNKADENTLIKYKDSLLYTLEMYFEENPIIEYYQNPELGFDMVVFAIYFNNSQEKMPHSDEMFKYTINQILEKYNERFLAMREIIIGKDCIYIIKNTAFKNWTISKGFEDGKEILKRIAK